VDVKRKIPCFCDNSFIVEIPEEIDLDLNPSYMEEIQNGTFMNFHCPSCGKKHKPEFPVTVLWPGKKLRFEVFPELDRGEFYRRKKGPPDSGPFKKETIIGYPELADRLAVIRDGLEPAAVEAIKYFLHVKAEENYPDDEMEIWYASSSPECLEFHIHGIRQDEVAIMRVPRQTYEKTLDDFTRRPKSEIFTALRVRSYLSVKNTMRPEELK
jgi:hypothetical protein